MLKVSIITVTYNSAKTITDTLCSINEQDYENIEYIVIDGGSSDNTLSLVSEIYNREPLVIISEPDKGIYDAMNKGVNLATGDIVAILNSDDFYPDKNVISRVVSFFKTQPDAEMLFGNVEFIKSSDLTKPVRFYPSYNFKPWKMRFGFMPAHPASFIRHSVYQKVGKYSLGYSIAADFEWFIRALIVRRSSFFSLNQTLVCMRQGGVSTSGVKSYWVSTNEQILALRNNGVYSNFMFVLIRLPIKFFQIMLLKYRMKK